MTGRPDGTSIGDLYAWAFGKGSDRVDGPPFVHTFTPDPGDARLDDLDAVEAWTAAEVIADTRELSRAEWLQLRRTGIGGSDAAVVCGLSRWSSRLELWLDKTGVTDPAAADGGSEPMRWGQLLEPVVRDEVAERLGIPIRPAPYMLRSYEHPFALVNLDGLAHTGHDLGPAVYEGKIASEYVRGDWDDDEVPVGYVLQCQHALAVTGLSRVVIGVLIGGNRLEIRELERDDELIAQLLDLEREFWTLVETRQAPAPDGSRACTRFVSDLYDARPGLVVTVDEVGLGDDLLDNQAAVEALIGQRAAALADVKAAEARADEYSNRLRVAMGEATELVDRSGRALVTWREQVRRSTGFKVDAGALRHAHPTLARYLTTETPSRVLRTPTRKGK